MLEGKEFVAVDMVFLFVDGFVDRGTGYAESVPMTRVHSMYRKRVKSL